jgi:tetratricopeptide (TPR) repeat protein
MHSEPEQSPSIHWPTFSIFWFASILLSTVAVVEIRATEATGSFDKNVLPRTPDHLILPHLDNAGSISGKPKDYLERADLEMVVGEFDKAIIDFSYALYLNPLYAEAHYGRALAYLNTGDYDGSVWDFDEVVRLRPGWAPGYAGRGNANERRGDYSKSKADYTLAIHLDPRNTGYYIARGNLHTYLMEYSEAMSDYDISVRINPFHPLGYASRGLAHAKWGEADAAIDDFTKAIELFPAFAVAYEDRGVVYASKGDYDKAIDDLSHAIALEPKRADAYQNRAKVYTDKGDFKSAAMDFTQANRLSPQATVSQPPLSLAPLPGQMQITGNSGGSTNQPGKTTTATSRPTGPAGTTDPKRAIDMLTQTIAIDPTNAIAYRSRGQIYRRYGDYIDATADFSEAIRLGQTNAIVFLERGEAYTGEKDYDRALTDLDRAIQLDPSNARTYDRRGLAYFRKGNMDAAITNYTEAIRLDPNLSATHCNRASAYRHKGLYSEAIADYDSAIRLNAAYARAYNSLAWLLAVCPDSHYRDGKKAIEYATQACELAHWKTANYLGTLAAACAESGDFDHAVKWEIKSQEFRWRQSKEDQRKSQERLTLYKDRKPYHEESEPNANQ